MARVKTYTASVHYTGSGSTHTKEYPFTEAHANEIGGTLEVDGLDVILAQKLCDKWTRRGNHDDVKYRYWLT